MTIHRSFRLSPGDLKRLSDTFEDAPPEDILTWGFETFAPDIAQATGFGLSGVVLMHMVSRLRPETTIFYLDTDLFFDETYQLRDELADRLGVTFTRLHSDLSLEQQAEEHGEALWERNPDQCCFLRKVEPLRRFLSTQQAWITGLRRGSAVTRERASLVEWDTSHQLVKLNPLANWSVNDLRDYITLYDLPYNPLHDEGYPSIGCVPCTRPVARHEDERAGRWAGFSKTECGIHLPRLAS